MSAEKNKKETTNKTPKKRTIPYTNNYKTNTGHNLTIKEAIFIDKYIELNNGRQAVLEAGYKSKAPEQYASELLRKPHIKEEIQYRLELLRKSTIAEADEILQYFTGVMRGEVKDQFGLDAPLGERTKAAQELAKRMIDLPNRLESGKDTPEVKITLNWERPNLSKDVDDGK